MTERKEQQINNMECVLLKNAKQFYAMRDKKKNKIKNLELGLSRPFDLLVTIIHRDMCYILE